MKRASRDLVAAVNLLFRHFLRQANRRGWPARERFIVLAVVRALVEETPFWERREPRAALQAGGRALSEAARGHLDEALRAVESDIIVEALIEAGGKQSVAAKTLGIAPRSMWHRVKKLGIDVEACRKEGTRR